MNEERKIASRWMLDGPRMETIKQYNHNVFKCLQCGSARMTLADVGMFSCNFSDVGETEESWDNLRISFDKVTVLEDSKIARDPKAWAYNPSGTGKGLRISMACGDCRTMQQLVLAGHDCITQSWEELIYPNGTYGEGGL